MIEQSSISHCLLINAAAEASLRNAIFQPAWSKLLSSKISLTWNTFSLKTIINIRHLSPSHSNPATHWDLQAVEMWRRKPSELLSAFTWAKHRALGETRGEDSHWEGQHEPHRGVWGWAGASITHQSHATRKIISKRKVCCWRCSIWDIWKASIDHRRTRSPSSTFGAVGKGPQVWPLGAIWYHKARMDGG